MSATTLHAAPAAAHADTDRDAAIRTRGLRKVYPLPKRRGPGGPGGPPGAAPGAAAPPPGIIALDALDLDVDRKSVV